MKVKYLGLVFLICICTILCGCKGSLNNMVLENIAEIREFVVVGSSNGISAEFTSGYREETFKLDGYATPKVEFGVITISVPTELLGKDAYFVLFVGTQKFEGTLERNPFDDTLVADIKKRVRENQNYMLSLSIGSTAVSFRLERVDCVWEIDVYDAVDIFIDHNKSELKKLIHKREFEGEIYMKIINDKDMYADDYFFHIYVIGRHGQSLNTIISPQGKILASSKNM